MPLPDELDFLANAFKPQKTTTALMDGKVCVITAGLPVWAIKLPSGLAQGGAEIVLVCRNPRKGKTVREELENTYGVKTSVVLADFTRLDEVRRAAEELLAGWSKLTC